MANYFFAGACIAFVSALQCSTTQAAPIDVVFVHGLGGFGPDELLGIGYWGFGQQYLKNKSLFPDDKFTTHEASVGPLSSNWDRACELYAQIVGGKVDYGAAHSKTHSHDRYGRTYDTAFVEDWGASKPISLVGHSMGGQTIRFLEILLNEGSAAEVTASGEGVSPLFKGGSKGWIRSLTSISTPHDGSPGGATSGAFEPLLVAFASATDDTGIESIYDLDLDHFGLTRQEGESFKDYRARVDASPVFEDSYTDSANYDLSMQGATLLNSMGPQAYPETTYFSFVTDQTFRGLFPFHNYFYPKPTMSIFLQPGALFMGAFTGGRGDDMDYSSWRDNDGVVTVISQTCPKLGVQNPEPNCLNKVPSTGQPARGKWHQTTVARDHVQVIGLGLYNNNGIYRDLANQILSSKIDVVDVVAGVAAMSQPSQPLQPSAIDLVDIAPLNETYGSLPTDDDSTGSSAVLIALSVCGVGAVFAGVAVVKVTRSRQAKAAAVSDINSRSSVNDFTTKASANNPVYEL